MDQFMRYYVDCFRGDTLLQRIDLPQPISAAGPGPDPSPDHLVAQAKDGLLTLGLSKPPHADIRFVIGRK